MEADLDVVLRDREVDEAKDLIGLVALPR